MNSLMIFANDFQLRATIISLVFFVICGLYFCILQPKVRLVKAVKYLILGFIIDFIAALYSSNLDFFSQSFSVNFFVFIELIIKMLALLILVVSGSYIMLGKSLRSIYMVLGLIIITSLITYFTLINSDALMVIILRGLLPVLAFAYLATAYFTQSFRRHAGGYIIGFLAMAFVTYVAVLELSDLGRDADIWYAAIIGNFGLGISFLLSITDIKSDRLDKTVAEVEKSNQRIKEIIKLSPFPIVISRLSDDAILMANDNFIKLFGIPEKDVGMYHFRDFFVDFDNRKLLNTHLEKEHVVKDFEILVKSLSGDTPFWLSTSANIIDFDYDIAIYAAFQDITDRKKREDMLQNQAHRDPLTSLYNRRYFEEEVNRRISANPNEIFSIFMIDADHFKRVNDTYGHKIGDKVLIELASTAEKALRDQDIVARFGGEEFVVYLSDTRAEEALVVADRLRSAVSNITVLSDDGEKIHFTVSIGISSSLVSQDINALIKMSDDALYQAKEGGRNRCVIYKPNMSSEPQEQKAEKAKENIHPAYLKNNNIEISLLGDGAAMYEDEKQ